MTAPRVVYLVASPAGSRTFLCLGDALRFIRHLRRYDPRGHYKLGAML